MKVSISFQKQQKDITLYTYKFCKGVTRNVRTQETVSLLSNIKVNIKNKIRTLGTCVKCIIYGWVHVLFKRQGCSALGRDVIHLGVLWSIQPSALTYYMCTIGLEKISISVRVCVHIILFLDLLKSSTKNKQKWRYL